jgi:hypothetical protein
VQNRLSAPRRKSGPIIRDGGTATLVGDSPTRPAKETLPFGHSYREVELRERGYVDYSVSLNPDVREGILGEIRRAHHEAGQEVEAGGWLFSRYRPTESSDWIRITDATRSGAETPGTRSSVTLGDPVEAMAAMHDAGLALVGDWHSHCVASSELPSMQDAKAWAGTMDGLGRSSYVSVLVSPTEGTGWMIPRFSAWVAGRYGVPSRPVVGRARIEW